MKQKIDKLVATVVACLILVLPGALSARERHGANLAVSLKDGQTVTGELIAVKPDSLLLFSPSGKDESVDLAGIRAIRIVRRSKAGLGAAGGFLAGAVVLASAVYHQNEGDSGAQGAGAIVFGAIGGVAGGLIGLGVGAAAGSDQTIQLEGMSESALKAFLKTLSRKARIQDFR